MRVRELGREYVIPNAENVLNPPRRETEPQKSMQNSIQQAANIYGAFTVDSRPPEFEDPVLLVDDIVDSRWTMIIIAALLREERSGTVYPLALADASDSPSWLSAGL